MADNPNYVQTSTGWVRKEGAPDAAHKSRINWDRVQSVENARKGVSELRQKQDAANKAHKEKHGS